MKRVYFFILFFFLITLNTFSDVLVFKNGKKIHVKKLYLKDGIVYYTYDGLNSSINKRYVDWERSVKETEKERQRVEKKDKKNGFMVLRNRKEKFYTELEKEGIKVEYKVLPVKGPIKAENYQDISLVKLSKMNKVSDSDARNINKRLSLILKKYKYFKRFSGESFLKSGLGVIPFHRNYQNMICVDGIVNDKVNVPFVFDTGASYTMINFKTAKKGKVRILKDRFVPVQTASGVAKFFIGYVDKIRVGNLTVTDIGVLVSPPGLTNVNLLGQNIIKDFKITIDDSKRKIFLRR